MATTSRVEVIPLHKYPDGSGHTLAAGVTIGHTAKGGVTSLSDWSKVSDLIAAGVLVREVWTGNGQYGHDTFRLA